MRRLLLALSLIGAPGCGDDIAGPDGGGNDSAAPRDLSAPADLAAQPDLAGADLAGADLAQAPDLGGGDGPTIAPIAILVDVGANAALPTGDGGALVAPVRVLVPVVGFATAAPHDYDTTVPNSGGCTGDHYSVAAGKLPPTDLLAGTIVFSGYAGGKFVDGTTAPSKISCARGQSGYYACGYGDLVNGAPGPLDPTRTPFGGNVMPITKDQNVAFSGSGGADVGAWNGMAAARDQVMLVSPANLSTVAYDATMDEKFTFTCPTEPMASCGFTAVVILIQASDQPPAMFGQPAQTFGVALCSGLALPGGLTFEKGALGAAFGCDKTGQNCDANLKSVQTTVIRIAVPTGVSDPMGHTINLAAGRGVAGVAPR